MLNSSIPGLLLDITEKNPPFGLLIEKVCPGNLVFMESIELSKEYFYGCIFSENFGPIFIKKLLNSFAISFLSRMFFLTTVNFKFFWEINVYNFYFLNDLFYFPNFLYFIFIFHELIWIAKFFRFAFNCFKCFFIW